MGNYSTLSIGDIQFAWKYYVPTFLTFLFEEDDFYKKPQDRPDGAEWFDEIGFKTSCARSLAVLNQFGFSLGFVTEVYDYFFDNLQQLYIDRLETKLADALGLDDYDDARLAQAVHDHLAKQPSRSRREDVEDFVGFLRVAIETRFKDPKLRRPVVLKFGDTEMSVPGDEYFATTTGHGLADFERLHRYFAHQVDLFPAGVVRVASMFNEDGLTDYFEIVTLAYTRLILEATSGRRLIKLDVADLEFDSEADVRELHSALANELVEKVTLYNRVFRALTESKDFFRERYAISKIDVVMKELPSLRSAATKGVRLEDAIASLFNAPEGLTVIERRYSTGDEEIDLLIQNDVDRPFWIGLSSPLIFVECKNWSSRVGSAEVRDFEVKIQNHAPLVRVGFLVSTGGFTRGAATEISRLSRADYTIALIGPEELRGLSEGSEHVLMWLERRLHRLN
jgi:hypothetical protein